MAHEGERPEQHDAGTPDAAAAPLDTAHADTVGTDVDAPATDVAGIDAPGAPEFVVVEVSDGDVQAEVIDVVEPSDDDDDSDDEASDDVASVDEVEPVEEKAEPVVDEVLLASVGLARAALLQITPAATIGEVVGSSAVEDHVLALHFESKLPGYPGWHWTVALSRIDDSSEPNVLEVEMLPGEQALIAPDWLPWSERLAEYQLAQELAAALAAAEGDEHDDDADELDDDESDDDEDSDDEDLDDDDLDETDDEVLDIDDHVTDDAQLESDDDDSDDDDSDDDDSDDDDADDPGEGDADVDGDDDFDDDPHAESYSAGR